MGNYLARHLCYFFLHNSPTLTIDDISFIRFFNLISIKTQLRTVDRLESDIPFHKILSTKINNPKQLCMKYTHLKQKFKTFEQVSARTFFCNIWTFVCCFPHLVFFLTQGVNKKYKSVFDLKQEKNISLSPFKYYVVAPYLKIHSLCCFCCDQFFNHISLLHDCSVLQCIRIIIRF